MNIAFQPPEEYSLSRHSIRGWMLLVGYVAVTIRACQILLPYARRYFS
jgi:hypothetical protein